MSNVALTMLNSMGGDLPISLDRYVELGLSACDLKDRLFEKPLEDLTGAEVDELARMLRARGLGVHCLSTSLGHRDLAMGELAWVKANESILDRVLAAADVLKPSVVRLIAATDTASPQVASRNVQRVLVRYPWMPAAYDAFIGRINSSGFEAVIENEARDCIVASPSDALDLFAALDPKLRVRFTWDIQNMWEMGTPPSVNALRSLLPILGMLHLKGGRAGPDGMLLYASSLAEATWPVTDIVRVALGESDIKVICLNPSHGMRGLEYDTLAVAGDDIKFLRSIDRRIS